jgi:outer membrane biosynthesis protein TonB
MTRERSPALIASALLHAGLLIATMITWPWTRELKVGAVVPVNIVSSAPATELRPAVQAEEEAPAQAEEPTPEAPPPEPVPPPPQPQPQPKPAPTPTPKTPEPKTPTPKATQPAPKTPPQKTERANPDFLDSLAADVAKLSKQQRAATKGPSRPETAREARTGAGEGLSAAALQGMADELQRRWNPNCDVEGGRDVRVRVTFTLGAGGRVVGEVSAGGQENSSNPVVKAAAERAIRAVYQASPFTRLPREFYGSPIAVNFNAREACA